MRAVDGAIDAFSETVHAARPHPGQRRAADEQTSSDLTDREQEVLTYLAEGANNSEIATALVISPKTVEHHVSRLYGKLGVSTRAEAAAYAARNLGSE